MAQIPFTLRELKKSWANLNAASQQLPRGNAHRLLLVYAVECGLKAMWLKQENRTLFSSDDIARTGHDLNDVIKQLRLGAAFPTVFHLSDEELAEFKVTQCVRRLIAQNMGNLRLQG